MQRERRLARGEGYQVAVSVAFEYEVYPFTITYQVPVLRAREQVSLLP